MRLNVFSGVLMAALLTGCGATHARIETSTPQPALTPTQGEVSPMSTNRFMPSDTKTPVELTITDLATRLGVPEAAIEVRRVEPVEWSDASLGCPQPGRMYAQVITPGFRIMLEVEGQEYEYHTDTGNHLILCSPRTRGKPPPLEADE